MREKELRKLVKRFRYGHNPYAIKNSFKKVFQHEVVFERPKDGYAITTPKLLKAILVHVSKTEGLDTSASTLRNTLRDWGLRGFVVTEDWLLTSTMDFDQYKADEGKTRCIASYIDAWGINPKKLKLRPARVKMLGGAMESDKPDIGVWSRPDQVHKITAREVNALSLKMLPNLRTQNLDRMFWTVDKSLLFDIIAKLNIHSRMYIKDRYDCDDFTRSLKARLVENGVTAVGAVHDVSSSHAYLAVIVFDGEDPEDELDLVVIEPQSGKEVDTGSGDFLALDGRVEW